MDADLFYTDKKIRVQKDPDTCGRGLIVIVIEIESKKYFAISD